MDPSSMAAPPSYGKTVDTYKKALATAASVTAYAVLARSMARELLPDEVRTAVQWGVSFIRARFAPAQKERHTIVIKRLADGYGENQLYEAARMYLATKINPRAMLRLCVSRSRTKDVDGRSSTLISMEPGDWMTDVFHGVEFKWMSIEKGGDSGNDNRRSGNGSTIDRECLELSFDAEHTETALDKYLPMIVVTAEQMKRQERVLKIFLNEGRSWHCIPHHHPSTFDTLAMDPALKQSVVDDLDRFLKRKDYYKRIGKAWKRGYLLYGPPGTGKSSLVAAMANYLRFNIYDLDLSDVHYNTALQRLLVEMSNKSILVIEDIDCCLNMKSREDKKERKMRRTCDSDDDDESYSSDSSDNAYKKQRHQPPQQQQITLSGLLNFIDGLWSTSGEERIIVFTTNYKDRLDPALLRPGRMDMHIYMGYCTWEAFKTLASNYHLIDTHTLFPEIQQLLKQVEVTPAEVAEILLRSDGTDTALQVLTGFLKEKRGNKRNAAASREEQKDEKEDMKENNASIDP